MRLLAIDPGSNAQGLACFESGTLKWTMTLTTNYKIPAERRLDIIDQLRQVVLRYGFNHIACEEPFLLGQNNNGMQRQLGMIELLNFTHCSKLAFYHPMTIKKFTGHGTKDKLEVALECGRRVKTEPEMDLVADAISKEAFDETDAVAVGLLHLSKMEETNEKEEK